MSTRLETPGVLAIETAAYRAWPAARVRTVDGWRLRFHWNHTGRANSVWPGPAPRAETQFPHLGSAMRTSAPASSAVDSTTIEQKLAIVDEFYFGWGQTPRFQVSPMMNPPDLCEHLAKHGYEQRSGGRVQLASLDDPHLRDSDSQRGPVRVALADAPPSSFPGEPMARGWSGTSSDRSGVTLFARPDDDWYVVQRRIMGLDAASAGIRRSLLERIPDPAAFACCWVDGVPSAVGVAVLDVEIGLVGIFGMATAQEYRRRGAASAILRGFARWARAKGGTYAYLQVAPSNEVALGVYAGLGFSDSHAYDYWVKPQQ